MARPVHFEIHATDPEQARNFYEAVFGWKFSRWGEIPYWVISTGEGVGIDGGLTPRQGPRPADDAPVGSFVNTIDVGDLDATVEAVTRNGGTVALEKHAVPTVGWLAYCKDPDGNLFGMMQSDPAAA
jgi:uncharacterized protein